MVMEPSRTTACARALAHHRSMEAVPFSWISIIGIRFEPRIGAASSINVLPNGNGSPAAAGTNGMTDMKIAKSQAGPLRPIINSNLARAEVASPRYILIQNRWGRARRPHRRLPAQRSLNDHAGEHIGLQHD